MNKGIVLIAIHLQVKCTYVLDETPSDMGLKVVYQKHIQIYKARKIKGKDEQTMTLKYMITFTCTQCFKNNMHNSKHVDLTHDYSMHNSSMLISLNIFHR